MVKVLVLPRAICPLKRVRPVASDTKSQLLARVAVTISCTPVPVETVASSVGVGSVASGEAGALSVAVVEAIGAGISTEEVFEIMICASPTTNKDETEIVANTFHEILRASSGSFMTLFSTSKSFIERSACICSSSKAAMKISGSTPNFVAILRM